MFDIDPSSLIGAVRCDSKTLLEVTDRVLIFISEVRNIHPSIEGSREEVKSLHGTLDTINGHLAGISITNATAKVENTGGLWPAAYKLIHDCKLTIHELYDCLAGFKSENPEGAHPKAVPKRSVQRERQLQGIRSRVRMDNQSLELVLHMISVYLFLPILF